jgi:hypothetical protein
MTISTISSTPELCDNCQRIDLSKFLTSVEVEFSDASNCYSSKDKIGKIYIREPDGSLSERSGRHDVWRHDRYKLNLGPLEAIVARKEVCSSCHFIATTFKKSHDREVSILLADSSHGGACEIRLEALSFGTLKSNEPALPPRFDQREGWVIPSMRVSCRSKGEVEAHQVFLTAPSSRSTCQPTLLARYQPARCDAALFRSWLQMCVTSHSQCRPRPGDALVPLRLIDVINKCLVIFAGPERVDAEYFALSYVWGRGPKEFVLTTENFQEYCQPRGLPTLPKTVSDAVTLTERMGRRYLWFDSLCIVSNDPKDKASQIPAMTSVYGNAMLTIIAAAGKDANHGLPGVSSFRREYKGADLGQYQIVDSHLPCHYRSIYKNTWATRAWTYQELVLSTRSLIFFDTHVEWLCKCTEWFEQLHLEHPDLKVKRNWVGPEEQLRLDISQYRSHVNQYTRRSLTFETGIVNAFAGIMAAIDDEFFWGVPYSNFCKFLTWKVGKPPSGHIPDQRRVFDLSIPSWSWLSWRGVIIPPPFELLENSLLAICRWRSGQLERICVPQATSLRWSVPDPQDPSHFIDKKYDIWQNDSEWTVHIDDLPSGVTLNENHLIFWAPTLDNFTQEECECVIVDKNRIDGVIALNVRWKDNIATRVGHVSSDARYLPLGRIAKKLIVME